MVATFYFHYLFAAIAAVHLAFVVLRWGRLTRVQRHGFAIAVVVGLMAATPGLQQLLAITRRVELWDFVGTPSWGQLFHSLIPRGSIIFIGIGLSFARIMGPFTWRPQWWRGNVANVVPLFVWWLGAPLLFFLHAHLTGHSMYLDRWFLWVAPASCIVVCALVAGICEGRSRFLIVCVAITFMIFREADRRWQIEDWRGAAAVVREGGAQEEPVLFYSGLVELESPDWIADKTKAPYLGGPFTVYPIGREPILLSSDPESGKMTDYYRGNLLPAIQEAETVMLVSAKKVVKEAEQKVYVFERWARWLEAHGFQKEGSPAPLRSQEITVQRFARRTVER